MTGKAIIFSAPSGAGKTTIVHNLLNKVPNLKFSISATTRVQRASEMNGRDYYFYSEEQFQEKIKSGELLEWEEVYQGAFYGTLKNEVEQIWSEGNHVIFDVDAKGGKKLKKIFGDKSLSVFIKVNGEKVLRERLKIRNTENGEMLDIRVNKAVEEMKEEVHFDKILLNDDLDKVIDEAEEIVKKFISHSWR